MRHSLFQILIQLSDGLKIFPLGFSNGNLTLSCCLWVDINKGLRSHNSLGFCKESNLTVQIIISIPAEFHCRATARLEFINIPYDIPLRDWKPLLTITLCTPFFGSTNCMHYFIQINDCPDSDNYKTAGDANLRPFQRPPPCHSQGPWLQRRDGDWILENPTDAPWLPLYGFQPLLTILVKVLSAIF